MSKAHYSHTYHLIQKYKTFLLQNSLSTAETCSTGILNIKRDLGNLLFGFLHMFYSQFLVHFGHRVDQKPELLEF